MDCSAPSFHGVCQARILEWVAMPSSRGWIFLTQGLNLRLSCLLHWQAGFLPLALPGKPDCCGAIIKYSGFSNMLNYDLIISFRNVLLFSWWVVFNSLQPHGLQHATLLCPLSLSQSSLRFLSIESVMPFNHLVLYHPLFLLPSIFPSIRVFSNDSALCIRWSDYRSFSSSPFNGYSGLIFLQSKGLSRVFSNTTVQKQQFVGAQPLLWSHSPVVMYGCESWTIKKCILFSFWMPSD